MKIYNEVKSCHKTILILVIFLLKSEYFHSLDIVLPGQIFRSVHSALVKNFQNKKLTNQIVCPEMKWFCPELEHL